MFLTTDMFFFYPLDIELQNVRSDNNSILWFSFFSHLKRRPHSEIKLPVAINIIYLSVEPEKSVSLDLVVSRFTAVASCSFYSPFDGQLLILRQLRCHLHVSEFFYAVEFNRAKKPTLEGSVWTGRLNLSSLSLISFSELNKTLDTN